VSESAAPQFRNCTTTPLWRSFGEIARCAGRFTSGALETRSETKANQACVGQSIFAPSPLLFSFGCPARL
jgi:hypothetical protein